MTGNQIGKAWSAFFNLPSLMKRDIVSLNFRREFLTSFTLKETIYDKRGIKSFKAVSS